MNFLSHLYLSGDSEGLLIGNYIADSVKGSDYKNYPEEIRKGILLHRKIDTYTDCHPVVEESKQRLRPRYRKYAGVITDVYYDHFLASNWEEYSSETLWDYTQRIYAIIQKNHSILPEKSVHFTQYMLRYNILEAYSRLQGIEQVLTGMSQRTKFQSNMEHAAHELKEHYTLFEDEFKRFFPELRQFVKDEIAIS
ncbi:MAG TPA: ACP phosphodiesterase [Bacteroidia bacterium]|jgi:acyl carrier protein phosphodiesterase